MLFCYFFHTLRDPTQAVLRAGYTSKRGNQIAAQLLYRKEIQQQIKNFDQTLGLLSLQADIIAGLKRMIFSSTADAIKLMFCDHPSQEMDLNELELFGVSEIKRPKDGALEIKFFDRLKALIELTQISSHGNKNQEVVALCTALKQSAVQIKETTQDEI